MMCPVPGCSVEAPKGNVFCPDHYFQIPPEYTRLITRVKFACSRCDGEKRDHLQRQLDGYIRTAIAKIPGGRNAA